MTDTHHGPHASLRASVCAPGLWWWWWNGLLITTVHKKQTGEAPGRRYFAACDGPAGPTGGEGGARWRGGQFIWVGPASVRRQRIMVSWTPRVLAYGHAVDVSTSLLRNRETGNFQLSCLQACFIVAFLGLLVDTHANSLTAFGPPSPSTHQPFFLFSRVVVSFSFAIFFLLLFFNL